MLKREGFPGYRLDGSLSQKQRTQVLQEFAEQSSRPKVFAISLKAGGVGLNLTNANYVFMVRRHPSRIGDSAHFLAWLDGLLVEQCGRATGHRQSIVIWPVELCAKINDALHRFIGLGKTKQSTLLIFSYVWPRIVGLCLILIRFWFPSLVAGFSNHRGENCCDSEAQDGHCQECLGEQREVREGDI